MAGQRTTEKPLAQRENETARGVQATRVFHVIAPSGIDARLYLEQDLGVARGAVYTNAQGQQPDTAVKCRELPTRALTPTPIGGNGLWEITANFSDRDDSDDGDSRGREPTPDGVKVYAWSRSEATTPIEVDNAGKVIANSRGEPYDPRLTVVETRRFARIRWYETNPNLAAYFAYDDAINASAFTVQGRFNVAAGACLHHGIDPVEEDTDLWYMEALLEFRPGGLKWHPFEIPDYTLEDGKRKWLDGNGDTVELGPGQAPTINSFNIAQNLRSLAPLGY